MLLRIIFIITIFVNVAHANDIDKPNTNETTIIVLGDSLSAAYGIDLNDGWVNLLNKKLLTYKQDQNWKIINASVSGETTAGGLIRLNKLINEHNPTLCIIALGANDGLRGLSLHSMQENLDAMVKKCNASGDTLLIGNKLPPNYGAKYTEAFHKIYSDVAKNNNISYVPFMLEGIALEDKYFQADRLHPTADAQAVILENIWVKVREILPAISSQSHYN